MRFLEGEARVGLGCPVGCRVGLKADLKNSYCPPASQEADIAGIQGKKKIKFMNPRVLRSRAAQVQREGGPQGLCPLWWSGRDDE